MIYRLSWLGSRIPARAVHKSKVYINNLTGIYITSIKIHPLNRTLILSEKYILSQKMSLNSNINPFFTHTHTQNHGLLYHNRVFHKWNIGNRNEQGDLRCHFLFYNFLVVIISPVGDKHLWIFIDQFWSENAEPHWSILFISNGHRNCSL